MAFSNKSKVPNGRTGYKEIFTGPKGFDRKAEEEGTETQPKASVSKASFHSSVITDTLQYSHYLSTWDPTQKFPPLEPFIHLEHGLDADSPFPDLLPPSASISHLTPIIGSVISGIQLSTLTSAGKDQLALVTAQSKVLLFRCQDFADLPIEDALAFGAYFGRRHIMPTSGSPKGHPKIHIIHRGAGDTDVHELLAGRTSSITWHSDVTYE